MKRVLGCATAALVAAAFSLGVTEPGNSKADEREIRAMYAAFRSASREGRGWDHAALYRRCRAVRRVTAREYVGTAAIRKDYQEFFAAFPGRLSDTTSRNSA